MKIFLVFYLSTFGHPPSVMPEFENFDKSKYVYFKSNKECENYLVLVGTKKYKYMRISSYGGGKFLKNAQNTQFLICKEFNKSKLQSWE